MTDMTGEQQAWFRNFSPAAQAPVRLFCLPHAGGSASYYFPVARALAPDVDVYAVQYPGRQDRRHEPCVEDVDTLADRLTEAMAPLTDRPWAIFGHSMGAVLGFEVARRLEARGTVAAALFVSGRRAPLCDRNHERWHLSTDAELVAEIKSMNGAGAELLDDEEVLRMVLPAIRSDYRAVETYRYRPGGPLRCPVIALTGDSDPKADVAEVAAWRDHTDGTFDLRVFPGGHFYLDEQRAAVLDAVAARLARRPQAVAH